MSGSAPVRNGDTDVHDLIEAAEQLCAAEAKALAAIEAEADAEIRRVVPEGFYVDTAENASWVVRKILGARQYRQRVEQWAAAETRRAEREEEQLDFMFGGQLRAWTKAELARRGGRTKSVNLTAGRVGYRSVPPLLVVENESAVLTWAKQHCPAAVVVVERVQKTPLNQYVLATGELPLGCRQEPQHEAFFVK